MLNNALNTEDYKLLTGPIQVSIDITNNCNLRCLHCYNCSGENIYVNNEMSDSELLELVKDIATFKPLNVCFCGGETLLRKNILLRLIKELSNQDIHTAMVSNGLLLTKEVAKELKEVGIGNVQISIDGIGESHNKLRGSKNSFEKAVQALENLRDFEIRSGIAFSPTAWNINEFKDVVNLALGLKVEEVRVQALMPMGRGSINAERIIPTDKQYRELRRSIIDLDGSVKGLRIEWGDPIDHLIRFPQTSEFCYMFGIKANGQISPSIYLPFSVGDIRKHSIKEYWNHGLGRIWSLEVLHKMSLNYKSVTKMDSQNYNLPTTFLEDDIYLDIIDNKVFEDTFQ